MILSTRRRATAVVAAGLLALPVATLVGSGPPATAGPPPSAAAEPKSRIVIPNGLTVENSFVSGLGWVKPGGQYPSRIIVTNPTTTARSGVTVNVAAAPEGMSFISARSNGGTFTVSPTRITWNIGSMPAAANGVASTRTLVIQSRAATLGEDPEVVWKNISSTATLTYGGGPASTITRSHGPKVIPPGEQFDTARYGERPFPLVPVEYQDVKMDDRESAKKLDDAINSPANPGSTWNLWQEISYGQLFPQGTVPSVGIATEGFGDRTEGFTKAQPAGTCTGVTLADTPGAIGSPLYSERIKDGIYQLPGTVEYYGRDKYGTGLVGAVAGVGAIFDIDGGCGPTAKSVYDAAFIADPEIDYSNYDTDKDGVVDFFMMVFAGCGGNGSSQAADCPTDAPSYDNIWPHSSSLEFSYTDPETGLTGYISDDQLKDLEGRPLWYTNTQRSQMTTNNTGDALKVFVRVGPYNVNPETAIEKASVISHEYGHSLGLPDFYSLGSRETYGDWNLMSTDKSQHMDVYGKQEMGWIVPRVLKPGQTTVRNWRDSKADTQRIDWVRPDGTPYTLSAAAGDQGIHNGEAYVAKLPGRTLLKKEDLAPENKQKVWWSGSGNDFGCPPAKGHNLDIALTQALKGVPAGTKVTAEFLSRWDIEWDYDYGFVLTGKREGAQIVYNSNESENGYTTPNTTQGNPLGNPNANACQALYGQGITGTSGSYEANTAPVDRLAGEYPAPTWIPDSFDISELVGPNGGPAEGAHLRFSYATDPGLARPGWFIDNLVIKAGDKVIYSKDFEQAGGQDDPSVFNGGCKDRIGTGPTCTAGWNHLLAGAEAVNDHAYYLEMRDRSGFDNEGRGENDREAIGFEPGLLLVYTDEAHGYGNVGTDNPPAQSPLDSVPEPGSDTPNLDDAAFNATAERSAFSDASSKPWVDNYSDPRRTDNDKTPTDETERWVFDFNCLGFKVNRLAGNTTVSDAVPGDLNGDVTFTLGSGCGSYDYGFGTPSAATGPVTLKSTHPQITAGNRPYLFGFATTSDGKPAANATVTIKGKKYGAGETYQTVATARTDAAGAYRVQVAPITQTSYVAQVGSLSSAAMLQRVYARINIASANVSGRTVTFRGNMVPNYPGAAIGLAHFDANRKFTYVTQGRTDSAGNYVISASMPPGTYNFVVYTSARHGTDKGNKSLRVTIR